MLTQEQLDGFRKWQLEGDRCIRIEMGDLSDPNKFSVWVYDYTIMEGQFAKDPSEINLVEKQKEKLRQEIERLQKLEGMA